MKRMLHVMLIIAFAISCFSFSSAAETDYRAVYADVLDSCAALIFNGTQGGVIRKGEYGIAEAIEAVEPEDAPWKIGYAIRDISGDGIPELIIAGVSSQEVMLSYGSAIYAVYTYQNGCVSLTFSGWTRNHYHMMTDGFFYNQGSNGAIYTVFCTQQISEDGMEMIPVDYFFTYEKDDSFAEIGFYHNTDGIWDRDYVGNDELGEDEFWRLNDILASDSQLIELSAFAFYECQETSSTVRADWMEDVFAGDYTEITLDHADSAARIMLSAFRGTVHDLKLLSLELENIDDDGKASFKTTEIADFPALNPELPLAVNLGFVGTIPNYGISYIDNAGTYHCFALEVSGRDGSLLMTEF